MQRLKIISFSIQWILVTTISYTIVIAFTWNRMEDIIATAEETLFGGLFFSGLLCGLGQWRLIERHLPGIESWVIVNIFGMPSGLIFGAFAYFEIESILLSVLPAQYLLTDIVGIFFFAGIFLGTLQWLVLRRKVKGAFWWIPVSGFSWGTGLYLSFTLLNLFLPASLNGHHLRIGALLGTIIGIIIGITGAITIGVMLNNLKQSSKQIESTLSNNAS